MMRLPINSTCVWYSLLFLWGVFHLCIGLQVLTEGKPFDADSAIFFAVWPVPLRVALWGVSGLIAMLAALVKRGETLAWALLGIMPAERVLGYLWSTVAWVLPGPPTGEIASFAAMIQWLAVLIMIVICADRGRMLAYMNDPRR